MTEYMSCFGYKIEFKFKMRKSRLESKPGTVIQYLTVRNKLL